ncbi:hypothetical protein HXX76_006326 [Chlamydomonas incerta]|uniref:Uncharacterized protein n=1 Tax=Chlamydomonas incerta TaxID=51695 RepID=A0A835T616_CHLIN|nr:hypothetical protein HXX76_006326 [Chlamydomonas incerta]|eukprot:KAG2436803.1 hypothetical protein HXX76_006326 [Chlamydomonas incerta]
MKTDSPSAAYTPRPPPLVPPASAPEGLLPFKLQQQHQHREHGSPRQQAQAGHGGSSSSGGGGGSSSGMPHNHPTHGHGPMHAAAGVSAEPFADSSSSSARSSGGGAAPVAALTMGSSAKPGGLISADGDVVLATRHMAAAVGVAGAADPNGRFVWNTDGSRQPWRAGDAPRGIAPGVPAGRSSFL